MPPKRHHYVPVAYLRHFADDDGRVYVHRKDEPTKQLRQRPENTAFRKYYYSQPLPDGGTEHEALEAFFSQLEGKWPRLVQRLLKRQKIDDELDTLYQFIALQRARVPAMRDTIEKAEAAMVLATVRDLASKGELPPPPEGFPDLLEHIEVSIDPHRSIHFMADAIRSLGMIFDHLGLIALHNCSGVPFITSDNPVLHYDPEVPESRLLPYTVSPGEGSIELFFPVTPKLAVYGHSNLRHQFLLGGLAHQDLARSQFAKRMNRLVCRFAYELVVAPEPGYGDLVKKYADKSPVLKTNVIPVKSGELVVHTFVFGPRIRKPKWTRE